MREGVVVETSSSGGEVAPSGGRRGSAARIAIDARSAAERRAGGVGGQLEDLLDAQRGVDRHRRVGQRAQLLDVLVLDARDLLHLVVAAGGDLERRQAFAQEFRGSAHDLALVGRPAPRPARRSARGDARRRSRARCTARRPPRARARRRRRARSRRPRRGGRRTPSRSVRRGPARHQAATRLAGRPPRREAYSGGSGPASARSGRAAARTSRATAARIHATSVTRKSSQPDDGDRERERDAHQRERHADRVDDRQDARLRHVDLFADRRGLCLEPAIRRCRSRRPGRSGRS